MKRLRTIIFWAHLTIGVIIAAVVLVMSVTGVLLTYQRQMQAWADTRGLDGSSPHSAAAPLHPGVLVEQAQAAQQGRATGVRWRRDPSAPVEVLFGRESRVFLNGFTGAVLGDGSQSTHAFFRVVTDAHRWLALTGDGRARGRAITGAANLSFLFLVLGGFYLWWPRNLTRRAFRSVLLFRRGLRGKARDFNWHNVIGVWSLAPLLVIIVSATVISYAWAGAFVERLATEESPVGATRAASAGETSTSASIPVATDNAAATHLPTPVLRRATAQMPDWKSLTMQLPVRAGVVTVLLDGGTGGQPQKQAEMTLSESGEVLTWEPFSSGTRPQRVRNILRYAHTGEVLGVAGQTIAGLVSAGVVLLVWTGISMALRRLGAWLGRRRRVPRSVAASAHTVR